MNSLLTITLLSIILFVGVFCFSSAAAKMYMWKYGKLVTAVRKLYFARFDPRNIQESFTDLGLVYTVMFSGYYDFSGTVEIVPGAPGESRLVRYHSDGIFWELNRKSKKEMELSIIPEDVYNRACSILPI